MTKVLIIEDDRDFADILRQALAQDDGIEVVDAIGSEDEALQLIRSPRLRDCDCVLLDLQLPRSPGDSAVNTTAGLRILEELRHHQRYYGSIIVLTNSRAPEDGQRALDGGCDGYLCKRARASEVPLLLSELKMAIKGDVIMVANQMRHVFLRDDISAKEARLLDLLADDRSWAEIARELRYKTAKAAANIGDRVFDKLLTPEDQEQLAAEGGKKRDRALKIWRSRRQPWKGAYDAG